MADFIISVIGHASDFDRPENTHGPACFKCRKRDNNRVDTCMTDDAVVWHCPACGTEGASRIGPGRSGTSVTGCLPTDETGSLGLRFLQTDAVVHIANQQQHLRLPPNHQSR